MRTYFDFHLKGKQIFYPVFLGLIALIIMYGAVFLLARSGAIINSAYLDWAYLRATLYQFGFSVMINLIIWVVFFFIVRAVAGGLSYKGEKLEADYNLRKYIWLVVKNTLLTVITLGIYSPWMWTNIIRYFAENTSFRYHTFRFRGKGLTLFAIMTLSLVFPVIVVAILMFIMLAPLISGGANPADPGMAAGLLSITLVLLVFLVISVFYSLNIRWFMDFSLGPKTVTTTARIWHSAWFIFGQMLLVFITLGFYTPMYYMRMYRYYIGRMVLGDEYVEDKFGFTMIPWKDYFYLLGQMLLSLVTIGVYAPWAYAKIFTRIFRQTYVDVLDSEKIPMPVKD